MWVSTYVYMDGIYVRRNWGGALENVAILKAEPK